jgi:hypothetical protein
MLRDKKNDAKLFLLQFTLRLDITFSLFIHHIAIIIYFSKIVFVAW